MFNSPHFMSRVRRNTNVPNESNTSVGRAPLTPTPDISEDRIVRGLREREIRRAALAERSRIAAERMKELLEEEKRIKSRREEVNEFAKKGRQERFYQDLDRADTEKKLIDLFNNAAQNQLKGAIKLEKEKVKNNVRNIKVVLEKKDKNIWTKAVAVAYGKLLTAIDPMISRIYSIPGMKGGKKKRRKTKKKKRRKKGGVRTPGTQFPELGKKINELMKKVKEINARLHDVEHWYGDDISTNANNIQDLYSREGYLRSYINFVDQGDVQGAPPTNQPTKLHKWADHIDNHIREQRVNRADVHDFHQGGRKRKSRRKRKRRKKRTRKH